MVDGSLYPLPNSRAYPHSTHIFSAHSTGGSGSPPRQRAIQVHHWRLLTVDGGLPEVFPRWDRYRAHLQRGLLARVGCEIALN